MHMLMYTPMMTMKWPLRHQDKEMQTKQSFVQDQDTRTVILILLLIIIIIHTLQ